MNSGQLHCTATKILNSEIAKDEQILPLALEMRPQDTCGKILVALEMKPQDRISGDGWKSQSFPVWRTIQLSGTVQNCPGLRLYILGRLDVHCLGQRPLSQDQRSYLNISIWYYSWTEKTEMPLSTCHKEVSAPKAITSWRLWRNNESHVGYG